MGEEDDKKPEELPKAASDQEKKEAQNNPPEKKEAEAIKEQPLSLPQPPQDIVLTVFMHCEGCARKVRRCLKGFEGVETVETDCRTHRVVVKGENADPLKILGRLQRKSHRRVELISPIPEPPAPNPEPIEKPKTEEKKPDVQFYFYGLFLNIYIKYLSVLTFWISFHMQRQILTVVLKVHMHCEACAQEIKRRIHRIKGVESVDPDLKSSQVTVKGAIDPAALVEYVHRRTGKHAAILKQGPEITPENNSEDAAKEDKEEKKADAGDGKAAESEKKVDEESKVEEKAAAAAADGEAQGAADPAAEEALKVVEVKKNEYHCYPQRYIMEMYPYPPPMIGDVAYQPPVIRHAYPPQMFSDENPNACSVM